MLSVAVLYSKQAGKRISRQQDFSQVCSQALGTAASQQAKLWSEEGAGRATALWSRGRTAAQERPPGDGWTRGSLGCWTL